MTNKIRNLFKRFKKNKSNADDHDVTDEVYFDEELDEVDAEDSPPEVATPEELMAQGELDAEEFDAEEFEAEDIQAEEFDEDSTGTYEAYDLDQQPSLKEKLIEKTGTFSRKLKDKLNKIDARKFKTPKFETGSKTLTNIKLPKGISSTKLKNFHVEIFSPNKRNAIHKGFQYAIIFGTVFIAGKNLALLLKGTDANQGLEKSAGPAPIEDKLLTLADANKIKNSGLFKTEAAKPVDVKKPVIAQNIKCEKADKKSRLPIKLLNTVVLQDSVKSIASVQVRSELAEIREGDKINDMAKVDLIGRQKIIVKNLRDGACEVIENDLDEGQPRQSRIAVMSPSQSKAFKKNAKKPEGIQNEGNNYTVEKKFIQEKMKNISDVLTQARGIQMTNPDGTLSFKIVDVEPGGIFSYLGIQNNDVITQINGKKISNLNEVMGLFGKISNVDKMNITVNRNGEEVPLKYNIQ